MKTKHNDILTLCSQRNPPRLIDVKRVAAHPQFNAQGIAAHRASADVALVQAAEPLTRSRTVALTAVPLTPIAAGNRYSISGIGVTIRGDGKSGGTVRSASLVSTSKPGTLQIRLVDPTTENKSACSAPALAIPADPSPASYRTSPLTFVHKREGTMSPAKSQRQPSAQLLSF